MTKRNYITDFLSEESETYYDGAFPLFFNDITYNICTKLSVNSGFHNFYNKYLKSHYIK